MNRFNTTDYCQVNKTIAIDTQVDLISNFLSKSKTPKIESISALKSKFLPVWPAEEMSISPIHGVTPSLLSFVVIALSGQDKSVSGSETGEKVGRNYFCLDVEIEGIFQNC